MKILKDKWKNSAKSEKISIVLLIICILLYALFSISELFNAATYTVVLVLLGAFLLFYNRFNVLCPSIMFYIFYCYSVAIGPIVLYCNNTIYNFNYFLVVLGGLLAFCIGTIAVDYVLKLSNKNKKNKEKDVLNTSDEKRPSIIKKVFKTKIRINKVFFLRMLFALSFLASLYFLIKNIELLKTNINSNRINAIQGNGAILYLSQLPVFIVPMLLNIYLSTKSTITRIELIVLTIVSTFTLLLSGFKSPVITLYLLIIMVLYKNKKINVKSIIILGIVLILVTEGLTILRGRLSEETNNYMFFNKITKDTTVSSMNLNRIFESFPNTVPFQNGYTYLINLKMLLPGPDLDFTLWLKEKLDLSFNGGGITPTILGEFYINFGFYAIYIGMFVYGIIGGAIKRYFKDKKEYFIELFLIWQFAHAASGGIANVMIIVILYLILYKFVSMLKE